MATKNTHTKVYFLRTVRVRREHIRGDADDGSNGLMRVVERGETLDMIAPQALFLIVDETCLEVKLANKEAIEKDLEALAVETSTVQETRKKKAA